MSLSTSSLLAGGAPSQAQRWGPRCGSSYTPAAHRRLSNRSYAAPSVLLRGRRGRSADLASTEDGALDAVHRRAGRGGVVMPRASAIKRGLQETYDGVGRTVLMTGANSGIGLESSKQLVAAGCTVIMACRSVEKAQLAVAAVMPHAIRGGRAEPAVLDLGSLASVRTFAEEFLESGAPLDVLVCNAGVAPDRDARSSDSVLRTVDGFERTFGVNHLGHFALVKLLTPALVASASPRRNNSSNKGVGAARVVITSSSIHSAENPDGRAGGPATLGSLEGIMCDGKHFEMADGGSYDGNKAYKDSKLCNILFARELAARLTAAGVGITCNTFSPGFIPTSRLFRNQGTLAQVFLKYLFNNPPLATALPTAGTFMCEMVLGEEKGVTTGAYYCGPPDYQPEDEPTVLGFLRGLTYPQFKARLPSEEARRAQLGRRLWEVSESFVQETFDALDWAGVPASASTAGYAVELVERLATGSAGTGAAAGGVVEENSAVDHKRSSSRPLTGAGGVGPRH